MSMPEPSPDTHAKPWRPQAKATKHRRYNNIRWLIQALVFSGFIAQGLLYYLADFRSLGHLLPFMAYESLGRQMVSSALIVWGAIFFLTLIFGRFVCGWFCPIGFFQDTGERLLRILKVRLPSPVRQPRLPRYLLAGIILSQLVLLPLLASPVRIWQFDLHFQEPWLLGFPFHTLLFVLDLLAIFVVVGLILPLYFGSRPYCRLVCETGLLLDRISQYSFGRVRRNHGFDRNTCIGCNKCSNNCPQGINVFEEVNFFDQVVNPECITCLQCVNLCPNDTIVYSLRKKLKDTGKITGYLAQLRMKPEDRPRYLMTGISVVGGGYVGYILLPPSYFHTYLLLASIGGFIGWLFWKALAALWGHKKIEEALKEKAQSQVERETAVGLAPLSPKEKMAYAPAKSSSRWVGAGLVFSILVLASVLVLVFNKVPPRILLLDEIKTTQSPVERLQKKILHFGIPPILSKERLQIAYGSLQRMLEKELGLDVRFVTAESYGELAYAFQKGELDAAILPPLAYLSMQRRQKLPEPHLLQSQNRGSSTYRSFLITRDPQLKEIEQLKGKRMAVTSPDSLSGYVAPLTFLRSKGVFPLDFSQLLMAGDHSKALQLLADGKVDVVATYEDPFEAFRKNHPEFPLHILAVIPDLPTDVVVIHPEIPSQWIARIQKTLLSLSASPGAEKVFSSLQEAGISGFVPFDGKLYGKWLLLEEKNYY